MLAVHTRLRTVRGASVPAGRTIGRWNRGSDDQPESRRVMSDVITRPGTTSICAVLLDWHSTGGGAGQPCVEAIASPGIAERYRKLTGPVPGIYSSPAGIVRMIRRSQRTGSTATDEVTGRRSTFGRPPKGSRSGAHSVRTGSTRSSARTDWGFEVGGPFVERGADHGMLVRASGGMLPGG